MNSRKKILIVEDHEINRAILRKCLEQDYEIVEAVDGEDGIEKIQEYGLALSIILLDIIMPKLDGFGVLEFMNEYGYVSEIPVIAITVDSKFESENHAFDLGVCDFIAKPFHHELVKKRVQNMIDLFERTKCLRQLVEEQTLEIYEQSELIQEQLLRLSNEQQRK